MCIRDSIRRVCAVHSQHTKRELMSRLEAAQPHQRRSYGKLKGLGKCSQWFICPRIRNSSADVEYRSFSIENLRYGTGHISLWCFCLLYTSDAADERSS